MGSNSYVDGYCERLAPGFWGEPLNSISNLAFLLAAVATWLLAHAAARQQARPAAGIHALGVIIGLVFLGSAAFHTTATRWGAAVDTGFIAVFLLFYIALFTQLFWSVPWRLAWLAAPAFLLFTAFISVAADVINFRGPTMYLSALLGLFILAAALRWSRRPELRPHWRLFALAGAVFAVSLTLRTLDEDVCATLPTGTHFLWHTLNALTLYLVSRAAITRWHQAIPTPTRPTSVP